MDAEYLNRRLTEEYVKAYNEEQKILTSWVARNLPKESTDILMDMWERGFKKCISILNNVSTEEKEQRAAWLRSHEPVTPNTNIKNCIKVKRRTKP